MNPVSVRGDRGQVAGIEVLPFGLLVFVAGGLLMANLWGVVDAKFATDAAAREAARWVVERAEAGATPEQVSAGAGQVARDTLADHGRVGAATVHVGPPGTTFDRCARITVRVGVRVPALRIPFVGGFGDAFEVAATHAELIDPTRSGVPGVASCIR